MSERANQAEMSTSAKAQMVKSKAMKALVLDLIKEGPVMATATQS
jgi:hypothetical protein